MVGFDIRHLITTELGKSIAILTSGHVLHSIFKLQLPQFVARSH